VNEVAMMKDVYIFGAGIQGQIFLDVFKSLGLSVSGFIDDYAKSDTCNDLPVLRVADCQNKNADIYISVGLISAKIKADLRALGFDHTYDFTQSVMKFPDIIHALKVHSLWYSDTPADMVDAVAIAKFRTLLSDEKSQLLLDQIAAFRTDFSPEHYVMPDDNTQYFPGDIDVFAAIDRVRFVDAGAYNGDTVTSMMRNCNHQNIPFEYAACFEPDPKNLRALQNKVTELRYNGTQPHIFIYPAGAWNRSEALEFSADQAASSRIADRSTPQNTSETVFGLAIDDCVFSAAPNFIKMDIEGAEKNALIGARETIISHRPVLAICLYHRPSDLWELPLFIHELVEDYDMYLRVYGDMLLETVLYCLPK